MSNTGHAGFDFLLQSVFPALIAGKGPYVFPLYLDRERNPSMIFSKKDP